MKKFNNINYLMFVLVLVTTITNAERSWRETAGGWAESGKGYGRAAFDYARNNPGRAGVVVVAGFTAAYMARRHFTRAKKWVQSGWAKRPPILGGKRKLTQKEQFQQIETKLLRFNVLMTSSKLSSKETTEKNEIEKLLKDRYGELEQKGQHRTPKENGQHKHIAQALSIAQVPLDENEV